MLQGVKKYFTSKTTETYSEEIRLRNYKSFQAFAVVGTFVSIAIFLFGLLMREIVTFNTEFLLMAVYCIVLIFIGRVFTKKHAKHITPVFYILMTPIMFMAIMMGTFLDSDAPSITIMVFMCVLPLFILDKPWRICVYISSIAIIYCIFCYVAKDLTLFVEDLIDLVAFWILAIGTNVFILHDRLENVENYMKFRDKAQKDALTGLYNRGAGRERIMECIEHQEYGAFCIIDVDDFKNINDTFGHDCGDKVLKEISRVIRDFFGTDNVFFRMGGDEFIVYCKSCVGDTEYRKHLDSFIEKIRAVNISCIEKKSISISVGCCIYDHGMAEYNELYRLSDEALYEAKRRGKNQYVITYTGR